MTTTNLVFPTLKQTNRTNIPYCLGVNKNTNEIYFIDRNYTYMGYGTKSLSAIREDSTDFERIYIYNDGSKPWKQEGTRGLPSKETRENYINAINKILNICKGKRVMWYDFVYIDKRNEYEILKQKLLRDRPPRETKMYEKKLNELLRVYNEEYLKDYFFQQ